MFPGGNLYVTALDERVYAAHQRFSRTLGRSARHSAAVRQAGVALLDALIITATALAAYAGRFGLSFLNDHLTVEGSVWVYYAVPSVWMALLAACGAYSLHHLQTGMVEYQRVALGSGLFAGAVGIACFLAKYDLSRGFFVLLFTIGVPALLLSRLARRRTLSHLRIRGQLQTSVLVAGSPSHVDEVARVLRREKWLGYQVVGAVTSASIEETPAGLPVLGRVSDVVDLVTDSSVDTVIFAEGSFPDSQHFKRMAWELEDLDVQMIVAPALTDISSQRLSSRPVAGLPLVYVEQPQAVAAGRWSKRAFDIIGSGLLLLVAAPIIAVVALAVKLEDRGPVFFKQTRVGRRGEEFQCLKIRSMVVDAEARKAELEAQNEGAGVLFKMAKDPRITKVGHVIRRFSIDELPQLWNVFRGDMSLVGPRPALPKEVAQYDSDTVRRLDVLPGLTGLWQVSGRSNLSWEETVRLDVYYVDNWSIMQDLTILMKTARAVFGSDGAY
ncbi:sugar transferase [Micropruina sp.]|uniref:sugar transferase n=1 Tax=Micropruina sp. TaxID=2737536 RepID=UPI0039E23D8E